MKQATLFTIAAGLIAVSAAGVSSASAQTAFSKGPLTKKQTRTNGDLLYRVDPLAYKSPSIEIIPGTKGPERYPWKDRIVTTVFWIGENPTANNPVPNHASSWDAAWARNYGGYDDPNRANRRDYMPVNFTPRQNPFYCALPYNDKAREGHRSEAPKVVPWFKEAYQGPAVSVCKDRWVAIRKGNRTVYAQWEDAGPFRTDHWEYVFGNERPRANLNQGAGLDVSPAVRDYLGLQETDVTDWKFVDFKDVPPGPWARHGDNNTFVLNARKAEQELASAQKKRAGIFR
ncbi:MAG: hypothetical protein H0X40_04605 [Chthoniobacterales bacterium]|nr:hypothetical protein [Chthoniobacterales bacterium]